MAKEYIPREDVINDIGELFTICRETYPNECGHHFIVEDELQSHLDFVRNLPAAEVITWAELKGLMVDKFKSRIAAGYTPTWNDAMKVVDELRPNGGQNNA